MTIRMKNSLFLCLFIAPLLLSNMSCGEIEFPHQEETANESNTDTAPDNVDPSKDNDNPGEDSDSPSEGEDNKGENGDSPNEGEDSPGTDEPDTPSPDVPQNQQFGPATLTADGHLLIADLLYLSIVEFSRVPSALSSTPNEAKSKADSYIEGNLTGWHIPTVEEANLLHQALACESPYYGQDPIVFLNRTLEDTGRNGIYRELYLCDEGKQAFDFIFGNSIVNATKTKKYSLRLVRSK